MRALLSVSDREGIVELARGLTDAGIEASYHNGPMREVAPGWKLRVLLAQALFSRPDVLLLDEPTNNLDPVSREQVLDAIARYPGAIVLVTHDPGAVQALKPDRAILLPDGVEDAWSDDLLELVELA